MRRSRSPARRSPLRRNTYTKRSPMRRSPLRRSFGRRSPLRRTKSPLRQSRSPKRKRSISPISVNSFDGGRWDKASPVHSRRCRKREEQRQKTKDNITDIDKSVHVQKQLSSSPVSDEESYLEEIDGKSIHGDVVNTEQDCKHPTGNFFASFRPIVTTATTSTSTAISTNKDDSDDRLQRLEKLVELLVTNNSNIALESRDYSVQSTSRPFGGIPELIPRNSEYTTSMWLNKIHEECIERNFDENTTIQFTQTKMSGIIKAWFKTISSYDFTWPELKLLIVKTFPDNRDFAETLDLLIKRTKQPDESMTQYFFSKMYLLEACKISGLNAVSCLIHGLNNALIKEEARSFNFVTPESLYSEYLSKFPADYEVKSTADFKKAEREVIEYEDPYDPEDDVIEVINESKMDQDYRRPDLRRINKKLKRCKTCDKLGHTTIQCKLTECFICLKKGHIAKECKYKDNQVLLCLSSADVKESNYLNCEINGFTFKSCVDTGCTMITIKESICDKLQLHCKKSSRIIYGYGGGTVNAIKETEVMIKVDLVSCWLPVVVVPDEAQAIPVIIGQTLLFHENVVTVIRDKKIRLYNKQKPCLFLKKFEPLEITLPEYEKIDATAGQK